ncbi:MAG: rRNA pseudouridine synthase [Treponema sp.]|nr:rRNA pseudouridine synthase [Treponema sp.]
MPGTGEAADEKKPRLQVYLAHAGIASRRAAEALIAGGRVTVNGRAVVTPGEKVLPGDEVRLDGLLVRPESRRRHLALHKPPGYICSSRDPQHRPLALDLLPRDIRERLYSVGRLDYLSSGLIFFTNDGDFAARLGHPRAGLEKEYIVEASGAIPGAVPEAFAAGLSVEGVWYRALAVEKLGRKTLRVVLVEGKNREIRRVFSHFHLHPARLHRIRIGPVLLGNLEPGESRPLEEKELRELEKLTDKTNETKKSIRRTGNW